MKKLLLSALIAGSIAVIAPAAAEAKTTTANAVTTPQIRIQLGNRRYRNRRPHVRTVTRWIGFGRNRVRQVVRITTWPNGRTTTQVISQGRYRG